MKPRSPPPHTSLFTPLPCHTNYFVVYQCVRSIRWALTIVSNVQVVVEMLGYKIGGAGTKWKWVRLSPPLLHARVLPL